MTTGMNSQTGKRLSGMDHLRQSIIDILTTPIGSRVMRPGYGSRLFELVDAPVNQTTFCCIVSTRAENNALYAARLICSTYGPRDPTRRVKCRHNAFCEVDGREEGEYKARRCACVRDPCPGWLVDASNAPESCV